MRMQYNMQTKAEYKNSILTVVSIFTVRPPLYFKYIFKSLRYRLNNSQWSQSISTARHNIL
jgi:hypothetical protein